MKKAVMYGAGKIGRGFIGKVFADSGYEVCFLDILPDLVAAINAAGEYTVRFVTSESAEDHPVRGVRALYSLSGDAEEAIADCDILATAVGVNQLPNIAPIIARAAVRRMERGGGPLDIILCENQIGAGELMRGWIDAELTPEQRRWTDANLGLVGASIGRMVPPQPPELLAEHPLMIRTESYDKLPVDLDAFKGPIPDLVGLVPYSPFEFYIKRKLFVSNGAHALCAYMGYEKGYGTIWEAMGDAEIYAAVRDSMLTSAEALVAKFGEDMRQNVEHEAADLLVRFGNRALGDTVARVGADPARKLRRNDRMVGAALFALEQGVDPAPIVRGILSALRFDRPEDPTAPEIQAALKERGIGHVMEKYMGLRPDEPLYAMIGAEYGRQAADKK